MPPTNREYAAFVQNSVYQCCWACGRTERWEHKPNDWCGSWWLQKAHVVNSPRVEDVRAVVIQCPLCHSMEHGHRYPEFAHVPKLTIANLLWLKLKYDPTRYDRTFLQRYCLGKLPRAQQLPLWYDNEWLKHLGEIRPT